MSTLTTAQLLGLTRPGKDTATPAGFVAVPADRLTLPRGDPNAVEFAAEGAVALAFSAASYELRRQLNSRASVGEILSEDEVWRAA